ncbi:hypothetical protein [Siphonobacter sp.]|uniref:hypothetical protein n=1 Tax=Siphonobacter sp. TaxID=1869184 RepID=UPI003B3B0645
MLESFDRLSSITDSARIARFKDFAQKYMRHARIEISVLMVFAVPNPRIVVQIQQEEENLTDDQLVERALDVFANEFSGPVEVHVVVKKLKSKFVLSHDNLVVVGYDEPDFIAVVSFYNYGGAGFEYDGNNYWVVAIKNKPDLSRLNQVAKWVKHEYILKRVSFEGLSSRSPVSEDLTIEDLQAFFDKRPSLTPSAFSLEAGFSDKHVRQLLRKERSITVEVASLLLPLMEKYGYEGKPFDSRAGEGFVSEG